MEITVSAQAGEAKKTNGNEGEDGAQCLDVCDPHCSEVSGHQRTKRTRREKENVFVCMMMIVVIVMHPTCPSNIARCHLFGLDQLIHGLCGLGTSHR